MAPKKGWRGKLQLFLIFFSVVVDVGRHLAILYAAQLRLDAEGAGGATLAELTVDGRAFQVTLKELMNASFGASIAFQMHYVVSSMGGFGGKVAGMPQTVMVNTK